MHKVLAVSFCDRPGFNTKSILLQSAITVVWLKQVTAMNGTPGPVSLAPEEMFYVGRILQTICSLSLSKAVHVHLSILSLLLNFVNHTTATLLCIY